MPTRTHTQNRATAETRVITYSTHQAQASNRTHKEHRRGCQSTIIGTYTGVRDSSLVTHPPLQCTGPRAAQGMERRAESGTRASTARTIRGNDQTGDGERGKRRTVTAVNLLQLNIHFEGFLVGGGFVRGTLTNKNTWVRTRTSYGSVTIK